MSRTINDAKRELSDRICQYANDRQLRQLVNDANIYPWTYNLYLCYYGKIYITLRDNSIKFEFNSDFSAEWILDNIVERMIKERIDAEVARLQRTISEGASQCQEAIAKIDNFFRV